MLPDVSRTGSRRLFLMESLVYGILIACFGADCLGDSGSFGEVKHNVVKTSPIQGKGNDENKDGEDK